MPNTLEKQLREEILKRQQGKKQQEKKTVKPDRRKTWVLIAILGVLSLCVSLGRWQMAKSAPVQLDRPAPEGAGQNIDAYGAETI